MEEDFYRASAAKNGGGFFERDSSDWFGVAAHQCQRRAAVLAVDAMDASLGPVVQIARDEFARLVRVRAFEHKDQLIADVLMHRELRARLEPHEHHTALRRLVLPYELVTDTWQRRVVPFEFAQVKNLRGRRVAAAGGGFDAAGDDREDGRAVLALDRMDASVGPVAHVARRRDAELVGDGALDDIENFVAVVLVHRELGARRETREKRVPLGGLVSP